MLQSLKQSLQRRQKSGAPPISPNSTPVTIIKNPTVASSSPSASAIAQSIGQSSPYNDRPISPGGGASNGVMPVASAAMQAIKRHALDFVNPKELTVSAL